LKPEKALTLEAGTKIFYAQFKGEISVFERLGKNTIDWVKLNEADKWQTQNITDLNTAGAEISGKYQFEKQFFIQNISVSYDYIDQTKQSGDYISYYALDYLKHKAVIGLQHKIYGKFGADWHFIYENRAGTYSVFDSKTNSFTGETGYKPYFLTDAKLFWQSKTLEFYAEASNIFNVKYEELSNIQMPGQWIRVGVKLSLNFSKKS
jgi:iron complex outermembrane receptor protein